MNIWCTYTKTSSESVPAVCVDQQLYQFLYNGRHCNNKTLNKTPYHYRKLKLLNSEDLPTLFLFNAQALKSAEENCTRDYGVYSSPSLHQFVQESEGMVLIPSVGKVKLWALCAACSLNRYVSVLVQHKYAPFSALDKLIKARNLYILQEYKFKNNDDIQK